MGAAVAAFALRNAHTGPPTYRPLTFHRGALGGARFAQDGKTILYSAAWEGKPAQIYSTRLDSTESTALPLPSADLLSISAAGKLAILVLHGREAAIAEVFLAGGAPRELVKSDPPDGGALQFSTQVADWFPGDDRLAFVRGGQLEFPAGKVLVPATPATQVVGLRFSLDGSRIAFIEAQGPDNAALGVVDLAGRKKILSKDWEIITSLAWHPKSGELWFSGRKKGNSIGVVELYAIDMSGGLRLVAETPQLLIVEDIARDGSVLARSDDWPETMMCLAPGAARELNLTWHDFSEGVSLSADGQDLLFVEGGASAGAAGGVYMRKTDGSNSAVRLGDGWISLQDLSPDKKTIVQVDRDKNLLNLLPVGPGESKTIQDKDFRYRRVFWFPDGKRILVTASTPGHGPRVYVRDLSEGPPRPITPEGTGAGRLSPDGKRVVAVELKTSRWAMYPVEGGPSTPLPGIGENEQVLGFDDKSQGIYVASGDRSKKIDRLDLATGKRTFFREVAPADPTGSARFPRCS